MAQLNKKALDRAASKVKNAAQAAALSCDDLMSQMFAAYPGLSVADAREGAIYVMQACLEKYGPVSAEAAAALYDQIMAAEGIDVPPADVDWAVDREQMEATAHYQAGKLASENMSDESKKEFKAQCCSYVRDTTRRAYDSTVAKNVERDSSKGVRYARMTSGSETCTFCVMVASRGFVYKTATSAGSGHKYHRGCDCYVVPGKAGSTTVKGVDLKQMRDKYAAFSKIDARTDLTRAQKDAMKAAFGKVAVIAPDLDETIEHAASKSNESSSISYITSDAEHNGLEYGGSGGYSSVVMTDRQFGKKAGKHAGDWGLDPSRESDRDELKGIISDIIDNPDEVAYGDWRSQEGLSKYFIKGEDVVVVSSSDKFVTILRGGVTNARIIRARNKGDENV